MDGPTFLFWYAVALVVLLLVSWVTRAIAGDYFGFRLLFALVFIGIGFARYVDGSSVGMHKWWLMGFEMLFGTCLFFLKADNLSFNSSGGSGCGSAGCSGGGGCGGGGCGGCGG